MKKVILSLSMIAVVGLTSCNGQTKKETTTEVAQEATTKDASFGVRGNCGMCKNTIEKAANSVNGVISANWDGDRKKIDVSFDKSRTTIMTIHRAIAASGYDTEKVTGSEEAYKNLPGCCQYNHEMTMNQTDKIKTEGHSGHNH